MLTIFLRALTLVAILLTSVSDADVRLLSALARCAAKKVICVLRCAVRVFSVIIRLAAALRGVDEVGETASSS